MALRPLVLGSQRADELRFGPLSSDGFSVASVQAKVLCLLEHFCEFAHVSVVANCLFLSTLVFFHTYFQAAGALLHLIVSTNDLNHLYLCVKLLRVLKGWGT